MVIVLGLGVAITCFWIMGYAVAGGAMALFLILVGGAATWYLPYPYDYLHPHDLARLQGLATALAIGMAPSFIWHLLRLPRRQAIDNRYDSTASQRYTQR